MKKKSHFRDLDDSKKKKRNQEKENIQEVLEH